MARIAVATLGVGRVVTIRPRRRLAVTPFVLAGALGWFGGVIGAGSLRGGEPAAGLAALPFLALAAWLAWRALWAIGGVVWVVVTDERITIERRVAGLTLRHQTVPRAEIARIAVMRPGADREEDDTDDRSFVRLERHGGLAFEVGRELDLSDEQARALATALDRDA